MTQAINLMTQPSGTTFLLTCRDSHGHIHGVLSGARHRSPLRFFGMMGASLFGMGALLVAWIVLERSFFGQELTGRPALLLSTVLLVLGRQPLALGLLREQVNLGQSKMQTLSRSRQ